VFIAAVLLLTLSGASVVGSFLSSSPIRPWILAYVAVAAALMAALRPLAPASSIHRQKVVLAVSASLLAFSALGFLVERPPKPLSIRELVVLGVSAQVVLAACLYAWRHRA
jgi:hypothetical protein